jgi:hypothetical protein
VRIRNRESFSEKEIDERLEPRSATDHSEVNDLLERDCFQSPFNLCPESLSAVIQFNFAELSKNAAFNASYERFLAMGTKT